MGHYLYATTHAHGMYLNFQGVPGAGNCDVYKLQQDNHKWVSWSGSKNWLRAGYEHKHPRATNYTICNTKMILIGGYHTTHGALTSLQQGLIITKMPQLISSCCLSNTAA